MDLAARAGASRCDSLADIDTDDRQVIEEAYAELEYWTQLGQVESVPIEMWLSERDLNGQVALGSPNVGKRIVVAPWESLSDLQARTVADPGHRG